MKAVGLVNDPGIVYGDVEPAEGGDTLLHHTGHICGVGHVRHNIEGFNAGLFDHLLCLGETLLIDVRNGHIRPGLGQGPGKAPAQP